MIVIYKIIKEEEERDGNIIMKGGKVFWVWNFVGVVGVMGFLFYLWINGLSLIRNKISFCL